MIGALVDWAVANPLFVVLILFVIYKQYQARQPWPDYGGNIKTLHSADEWKKTLSEAAAAGKVVVVDAYATWCPPCKAAAPIYARMSEEYSADTCVFTKFNTDDVRELTSLLGISAMPTFKVFKNQAEVGCQRGWSEAKVRELLEANGAAAAKKD